MEKYITNLEIRKELIKKGHQFSNDSDTECLIHGYEELWNRFVA